ncbi:MAG: AAA family ATPase [Cyanobacteriota bacterium]
MSKAGSLSSRGDYYQKQIAFLWALRILSSSDYHWLEIESQTCPVDDIVICKSDGSLICCQCKMNQKGNRAWVINDLKDDLKKAFEALANNDSTTVEFYSRTPFGDLENLSRSAGLHHDETSYLNSLRQGEKRHYYLISQLISEKDLKLSTYDFLKRTKFNIKGDFDEINQEIKSRLAIYFSNPEAAYDKLWTKLDKLSSRLDFYNPCTSAHHRLSKDDLEEILTQAGSLRSPPILLKDAQQEFKNLSAVDRSWIREIAGERVATPIVQDIEKAIDSGKRSILLTGPPGSGKTCVMLNLVEALEKKARGHRECQTIFIQSREFADLDTPEARQELGLPQDWVNKVARLGDTMDVIVIIDSLDVLSIAREHNILSYFLAQIDRLLTVQNVTVITACRDFDRRFDQRIARRSWDYECQCLPLDWNSVIVPILEKQGIHLASVDADTRELIRNPHELSLFIELAKREGSFNIVTTQALVTRYLKKIVQDDLALGDHAMIAIEAAAELMLRSRSLSIPSQDFSASTDIRRRLCSLRILQEIDREKLTFGHQTLLDALVISGATRRGITLKEFIRNLPQVPFVRPSIRSFVSQLAIDNRSDFRKQVRGVLTGKEAFHIRRLIAEVYANQPPEDEDWRFLNELRRNHRDVFQIIYSQAYSVEWHHFWLKHLVPEFEVFCDNHGMLAHVFHVAQWKNDHPISVIDFWMKALSTEWVDKSRIIQNIPYYLTDLKVEYLASARELINTLINGQKIENDQLGTVIARALTADVIDDNLLWAYMTRDVNYIDVNDYNTINKLRCRPDEFGDRNDDFLTQRMTNSTTLLNLAINTLEEWSEARDTQRRQKKIEIRYGFLHKTSYNDDHSSVKIRLADEARILFDSIQRSILAHARKHSEWWQRNRERLCSSHEGSVLYFACLACIECPQPNLDVIGHLLCNQTLLESDLSDELCQLIRAAFIYLEDFIQDTVISAIETVWQEDLSEDGNELFILRKRAKYIDAIPCHLRTEKAQLSLDTYEKRHGEIYWQPDITGVRERSNTIPFTYESFLKASDREIIRLLIHYETSVNNRDYVGFSDVEQLVGDQLCEASSRASLRFMKLLVSFWDEIPSYYCDKILDGISKYIQFRYGSLHPSQSWSAIEAPDSADLVRQILNELDRHLAYWQFNRYGADALNACAHAIQDEQNALDLIKLGAIFAKYHEENGRPTDSENLFNDAINMPIGCIAQAFLVVASNLIDHDIPFPILLSPTLRQLSGSKHQAVRALILRQLPSLQRKNPTLGWELFSLALEDAAGLWKYAESCMYYAYLEHFESVAPVLLRIKREGSRQDMEIWGRISALSALSGHILLSDFLEELHTLELLEAWKGAASVWTEPHNIKDSKYREQCMKGIESGLNGSISSATAVARLFAALLTEETAPLSIPINVLRLFFESLKNNKGKVTISSRFSKWLIANLTRDPQLTLDALELYLECLCCIKKNIYDDDHSLAQVITGLFSDAEEREESDEGKMLERVISIQDQLLALGVRSINEWLREAEVR